MISSDTKIRLAAFNWLEEQSAIFEDVFPRNVLAKGFYFEGIYIPLVSPQGIFKPRQFEYPLSISSTPKGPYSDSFDNNNLLVYRYRGTDRYHRDNIGLRNAMTDRVPLVYFYGIIPGKYYATWPVYIVDDNPDALSFKVAVDDKKSLNQINQEASNMISDNFIDARRRYITSSVKVRLHQKTFRERVLFAYRSQCAFCKLKHQELLDAAHILPDTNPDGLPIVSNGISLCKIHHAAFDKMFIAIRPDYTIEVRSDIMKEFDGPMLLHGLQKLDGQIIICPTETVDWPNRDFLEKRYDIFKRTG
jgi:putative restriction endonuclease